VVAPGSIGKQIVEEVNGLATASSNDPNIIGSQNAAKNVLVVSLEPGGEISRHEQRHVAGPIFMPHLNNVADKFGSS